jgi:hypothetical protein
MGARSAAEIDPVDLGIRKLYEEGGDDGEKGVRSAGVPSLERRLVVGRLDEGNREWRREQRNPSASGCRGDWDWKQGRQENVSADLARGGIMP